MADALNTVTNLINSPSGQIAAGGVLAGIVWKFFERVEAVLTDTTKFEIAVWLVGRKPLGPTVEPWPKTFAKVFDRVFGTIHWSWKCFYRSCLVSLCVSGIALLSSRPDVRLYAGVGSHNFLDTLVTILLLNVIPDYCSLLETRFVLNRIIRSGGRLIVPMLTLDLLVTGMIAFVTTMLVFSVSTVVGTIHNYLGNLAALVDPNVRRGLWEDFLLTFDWHFNNLFALPLRIWFLPAFFTSIWLWLYAGSGFILKAARRFDIGFDWFNRKFDIEKKPLSAIGLVAGALVAVTYWGFAVGAHFFKR